ncbi:MAG: rRNA small subunit 7-methylguanosine (m7G) methyltransferase GidB [Pseudonocardiales bacterium]|nr:rRNA small subunit 7-methylguanosine (m7G) methyltransferase GidB [Pseudonocardiales bacterium]
MSTAPAPPVDVAALFGGRLDLARQYAQLLTTEGVTRGLLGPREVPRLWERHLANCAVLTELLPVGARIVDVGSGAGLPGLVLAIRRPDLTVDLVDSLQRRTDFLVEVIELLGLSADVRVVRGRAEEADVIATVGESEWVTARAVAPLDRLVGWCLPLLRPGGRLLAIKGANAEVEVTEHGAAVRRLGGTGIEVVRCGVGQIEEPASVVVIERSAKESRRTKGRA